MNRIHVHFDGAIAHNHQVSMRTLGRTFSHLQAALDRAYIDTKYGEVWKHARMSVSDYKETEFLVQKPEEGGYILNFLADNDVTKKIVDRFSSALSPAVELAMQQGEEQAKNIVQQIATRSQQIDSKLIDPVEYEELVNNPSPKVIRKYSDRSITKEVDQILALIRSKHSGESSLEFILNGSKSHTFTFDKHSSQRFHEAVSKKDVGEPVIYHSKVISLDSKRLTGKIHNVVNERTANIHFTSTAAFMKAKSFLGTNVEMTFFGCPLIEYGAFDPQAGDIYFVDLA